MEAQVVFTFLGEEEALRNGEAVSDDGKLRGTAWKIHVFTVQNLLVPVHKGFYPKPPLVLCI